MKKENQQVGPISATSPDGLTFYSTIRRTRNGQYMITIREFISSKKNHYTLTKRYGFKTQAAANDKLLKIVPSGSEIEGDSVIIPEKKPVTNKDLILRLTDFVNITTKTDEFEFILGGDGRSRPWSEQRVGSITTIEVLPGVKLEGKQIELIQKSILSFQSVDKFIIK